MDVRAAGGDSVCVGKGLTGAQSMNFSVYPVVTASGRVGEA